MGMHGIEAKAKQLRALYRNVAFKEMRIEASEKLGLGVGTLLPRHSGEQAYLLIILRLVAAIVMVLPFSVTSPVSSTLWLRWGTSFALLFAARSPVTV